MTPFTPDTAHVLALLRACPAYKPTPLQRVAFGAHTLLIKDETNRMGLGAFKALGGPYAVARLIEDAYGKTLQPQDFGDVKVRAFAATMTFVCASAGNHGMAVAAGARVFGAKARIHLSRAVSETFAVRLRAQGADVVRSGATYEESLTAAEDDAWHSGAILLSDTCGADMARPPALVMEGYTVIPEELRQAFAADAAWPTHAFLQAGVGGLAGAVAHMIRATWAVQPEIIVVEPDAAPCLAESSKAGKPIIVEGPVSNMGRLDCKEPSHLAFTVLEQARVSYARVSDTAATAAAARLKADYRIASTPSGVAGFAALCETTLPPGARPLVIISEAAP